MSAYECGQHKDFATNMIRRFFLRFPDDSVEPTEEDLANVNDDQAELEHLPPRSDGMSSEDYKAAKKLFDAESERRSTVIKVR